MRYENNFKDYRKCFAKILRVNTECVADLDKQWEMIIFKSILTTHKLIIDFESAGAVLKIQN